VTPTGEPPGRPAVSEFDGRAGSWDDAQKVERARRVAEAIARAVPLSPAMAVLEYGAGTGLLALALADRVGHVTLADSSTGMLEVARRKIEAGRIDNARTLLLDLSKDPLPAARFDLVCSLLTLHHVRDTDALLRDFVKLLRAQGVVCLADLDREDGSFHGEDADVHRGFDRSDLGARMERAGFRGVRFETACVIRKGSRGVERSYPVFLAVASR